MDFNTTSQAVFARWTPDPPKCGHDPSAMCASDIHLVRILFWANSGGKDMIEFMSENGVPMGRVPLVRLYVVEVLLVCPMCNATSIATIDTEEAREIRIRFGRFEKTEEIEQGDLELVRRCRALNIDCNTFNVAGQWMKCHRRNIQDIQQMVMEQKVPLDDSFTFAAMIFTRLRPRADNPRSNNLLPHGPVFTPSSYEPYWDGLTAGPYVISPNAQQPGDWNASMDVRTYNDSFTLN